jgi:hypothetical protein
MEVKSGTHERREKAKGREREREREREGGREGEHESELTNSKRTNRQGW